MVYIVFVIFIVILLVFSVSEEKQGINSKKEDEKRKKLIDKSISLKERNKSIIDQYLLKINASNSQDWRYINDCARDCLNDIMFAEGESNSSPGSRYLSLWRAYTDNEFGKLSDELIQDFKEKQREIERMAHNSKNIAILENIQNSFGMVQKKSLSGIRALNKEVQTISVGENFLYENHGHSSFSIQEIIAHKANTEKFITLDAKRLTTLDIASNILCGKGKILDLVTFHKCFSLKDLELTHSLLSEFNLKSKFIQATIKDIDTTDLTEKEIVQLTKIKNNLEVAFSALKKNILESIAEVEILFNKIQKERSTLVSLLEKGLKENNADSMEKYLQILISYMEIDPFFQEVLLEYRSEEGILVINYKYIDLDNFPNLKEKKVYKNGMQKNIQLSQKAYMDAYDQYVTAVCIRTMYELFKKIDKLLLISFNGWIHTVNRSTGNEENIFIMSIQCKREECLNLNLVNIDPKVAFRGLKGISASKLSSLTPINPILNINTEDHRFVKGYEVVGGIDSKTNLAAMDWQDFENLIRELFGKEFGINGGEVKITQASRDGGVDAIAFDPDPIRGGKIVIQAKRYTNTVDVSAVRDLHGTVQHEGANKGILVTTATFGSDSYSFIKNKPLTLIDGSGLLYLLEKHNYSAKIDLREAKKILNLKQK